MKRNKKNNNRYRFKGVFDGTKVVKTSNHHKTKLTACFKNITNLSKNEFFRDHTHVVLDKEHFNKVNYYNIGQAVEFTASIYEYNKLNHRKFIQKRQQGLKDLNKLTKI